MLGAMGKTPRCMLQRMKEIPTWFHYYLNTTQMSIAGMAPARLPFIGLRQVEDSTLGNTYLIMVQISMLGTRMIVLHCICLCTRHPKNRLNLLKCYLNAG